jgi:hypothetical protein
MLDIPKEWPKYCVDLKPIAKMYKITLAQGDSKHNALEDARWVRAAHTAIKDVLWRSYKETELFI